MVNYYFYKQILKFQFVDLNLQTFQMPEMNFHLIPSDKVSENIHGHKKLPLPNHLQALDMYLETAETKQKKM